VLASLLTALVATVVPSTVNAAPRHNHGLTINAVPRHIIAGEGVLIFGRLEGENAAGQTIRLYHHINPFPGYRLVGTTTTDSRGVYEFTRAEGVVVMNRSWFVRGPFGTHSRTIAERVDALVSLSAASTTADTLHPVVFTGQIDPAHPFERVVLEQRTKGDDWHALKSTLTGGGSSFRIVYRFKVPGPRDLRAIFVGDRRNLRSFSDVLTLNVQQAQVAGFTINSSTPVINYGTSSTIAGVLDGAGTTTPTAGVPVTLLARTAGQRAWQSVASTTTGTDGSYRFTVTPTNNTYYRVRMTMSPVRHSATLFQGVRAAVTTVSSAATAPSGSTVTFTGNVLPTGDAGGPVYLQRLGRDGDWHTVAVAFTNAASGYSISWTLGDTGTQVFRTRVLGSRLNLGGASPRTTITVTPPAATTNP
jgi:hypothetical protein